MDSPVNLRLITYLCPSLPVEYFEAVCAFLESKVKVHTSLIYESRWDGPMGDRLDTLGADIGHDPLHYDVNVRKKAEKF